MAQSESPKSSQQTAAQAFGERMKAARKHQGITQKTLVLRLGTDQSKVSNWERGVQEPMSSEIARIALAIPTSADFLLGLTDDPEPSVNQPAIDPLAPAAAEQAKRRSSRRTREAG